MAKYQPIVQRLGHGELLGLLDAAGDELARRREIWERELGVGKAGMGIGSSARGDLG